MEPSRMSEATKRAIYWAFAAVLLVVMYVAFTVPEARANGDMPPAAGELGSAPTAPADTPVPPDGVAYCYPEGGACIVTYNDYRAYNQALGQAQAMLSAAAKRIRDLEAQVKAPPKCATLTLPPESPKRGGRW